MKPLPRCRTKFCRCRCFKSGKSPFCAKCRSRRFKAAHPIKYAFAKLLQRAKERGHEFSLTLADYTKFWEETGYGEFKGKTKHSLSIHRVDEAKGYEAGNVAAVTLSMNSRLKYAPLPGWLKQEMLREVVPF